MCFVFVFAALLEYAAVNYSYWGRRSRGIGEQGWTENNVNKEDRESAVNMKSWGVPSSIINDQTKNTNDEDKGDKHDDVTPQNEQESPKYECSTCVELFYTEEEREAHCRSEGHCHAFGMKVSPYSELYANQLLRDTEYEAIYGIDVVVMQRSQANMACDSSMRKLHKNDDADRSKPGGSFGHSQTPSSTNERQTSAKVKALSTTGGIGGLKSLAKAGERASRAKDDNGPITNEDWIRLEVSKYAKAAEMASETFRSSAPETHCMICRTLTPSEYVLRKLHVSSSHMDKDHAQSDYVEILSDVVNYQLSFIATRSEDR
uniref:C2H2-type domain-containing protein n=1 Tax=Angiostrongylus cantonensis TaxID=6313 RepID=A0A0K0DML3_ANGCA